MNGAMLVVDQMTSEAICQRVEIVENVIGVATSSRLGIRIFLSCYCEE